MKLIQNFLQEVTYWQKAGNRFNGQGKLNAPSFAWETVHGKPLPSFRRGRAPNTKERMWNNIAVDELLKNEWLEELANIKGVEIRSSCQGHSPKGEWPSFIIFRIKNESKVPKVVKELHDGKYTFCKADIGNMGFTRICVATPLFAKGPQYSLWEKWWSTIARRIQLATK